MDISRLKHILDAVRSGRIGIDEAMDDLRDLPYQDIVYAHVDHHRSLRSGFPEVIFGEGKSIQQIIGIMESMASKMSPIIVTRVNRSKADAIAEKFPKSIYYEPPRMVVYAVSPIETIGVGTILVVTAGTSDIPVAEEAVVTARTLGNRVETLYDVGVAGIHRLLAYKDLIYKASVIIVVAGMDGALPSVIGGLVDTPIVAVPTSAGYGVSLGGIAALFAMLNSCAPGVAVVNIDNGFGAGCVAARMNRNRLTR